MTRVKTQGVTHDQVDLMLHLVDILNVMGRPRKPLALGLQSDQRRRKSRILPVHRLPRFPRQFTPLGREGRIPCRAARLSLNFSHRL
jgi:hypothetical protein